MEHSNSELKRCLDSVTASSNDDEMLAKLHCERSNRRYTRKKEKHLNQEVKIQKKFCHNNEIFLTSVP